MYRNNLPLGITLVLLSASAMAGAYHIDYDQWTPGMGNPADEWFTPLANPGLILCESQGLTDKVNANPTPNRGEGGLCYASSQDFATCAFTFTAGMATDGTCTYNKTAADGSPNEKDKKPVSQDEWGMIEPKCMLVPCDPVKNETTEVGENWFARIGSNTRSCNGAWGQTFVYKEVIAYWGGSIPNPATGASGHVTFFVNDSNVEGTYDREKRFTGSPITDLNDKTMANCTGNGDSWGLIEGGVGKP